MYGFIVVLIFIFFGFALIFLEFSEGKTAYGDQLYSTFKILFADHDDSDYNVSQKLFTSLILFLLNVVLLNLLISIMGDSYDKVQEKRVLTDSLTRLDMSLEAMVFLRVVRRGKKTEGKGYLIYCETEEVDNEDDPANVEWEGRINVIKKTLKQTDQKVQSLTDKIDVTNATIGQKMEQKIEAMEQKVSVIIEQKMEQKIGAMEQKVEQKIGAMEQKVSAIIEQKMEQKIGAIEQKVSVIIEQKMEQKIGVVEQKIEAMEQRIRTEIKESLAEMLKHMKV